MDNSDKPTGSTALCLSSSGSNFHSFSAIFREYSNASNFAFKERPPFTDSFASSLFPTLTENGRLPFPSTPTVATAITPTPPSAASDGSMESVMPVFSGSNVFFVQLYAIAPSAPPSAPIEILA